jgi:hypothetical protein
MKDWVLGFATRNAFGLRSLTLSSITPSGVGTRRNFGYRDEGRRTQTERKPLLGIAFGAQPRNARHGIPGRPLGYFPSRTTTLAKMNGLTTGKTLASGRGKHCLEYNRSWGMNGVSGA